MFTDCGAKFTLIPKSCLISSMYFPWGCGECSWGNLLKDKVYYAESNDMGDSVLEHMNQGGHGALAANFTFAAQVQPGYGKICSRFASDDLSRLRRLLEGLEKRFQERLFQDTSSFQYRLQPLKTFCKLIQIPDVERAFCTELSAYGAAGPCEKPVLRVPKSQLQQLYIRCNYATPSLFLL